MSIDVAVERFIIEELLLGNDGRTLHPDESLYTTGVLDSLALLRLILFLEEEYGVTVDDREVIPDNFDSLRRLRGFLERRQRPRPAP